MYIVFSIIEYRHGQVRDELQDGIPQHKIRTAAPRARSSRTALGEARGPLRLSRAPRKST